MRQLLPVFALGLLAGCSISAGAGVGARVGHEGALEPECDNFESCDVAYQDAVEVAQHCHDDEGDCEDEERNVRVTYGALREQTERELGALRAELEERNDAVNEGSFSEPHDLELNHPVTPGRVRETAPPVHDGNSWFDSDSDSEH